MKSKTAGFLAAGLLAGPIAANAVTLHVNANGTLTGASNVDVGGTLYDVQFLDGSCVDVFTDCDNAAEDFVFTTSESAMSAAQALLDQVFTDSALGLFDFHPELTNGCTETIECGVITPYAMAEGYAGTVAYNLATIGGFAQDFECCAVPELSWADFIGLTFAVWSLPTTVPESGSLALLGLGLLGLGVVRRRAASGFVRGAPPSRALGCLPVLSYGTMRVRLMTRDRASGARCG